MSERRKKYLLKKIAKLYLEYSTLVQLEQLDKKLSALDIELKNIKDDTERLETFLNGIK